VKYRTESRRFITSFCYGNANGFRKGNENWKPWTKCVKYEL